MVPTMTDCANLLARKFGFEQARSRLAFPHLDEETQGSADCRTLVKLLAETDLSRSRAVALVALFQNVRNPESPGSEVRYGHLFAVPAGEVLSLFKHPFYSDHAAAQKPEPSLSQLRFTFLLPSSVEEGQREKGSISSKDGAYYHPSTYSEVAGKLTLSPDTQKLLLPFIMKRFLLSGDYAGATYVSGR